MTVLFGLAALAVLLWMAQKYLRPNPEKLAALLKLGGGVALLGFAALLALKGRYDMAIALAGLGLGLVGWIPFGLAGAQERADAQAGGRGPGSVARGRMTPEEAYQVLGLERGASTEDIVGAHRTLMKKLHPDLGGTNYLAARINEAKATLLGSR